MANWNTLRNSKSKIIGNYHDTLLFSLAKMKTETIPRSILTARDSLHDLLDSLDGVGEIEVSHEGEREGVEEAVLGSHAHRFSRPAHLQVEGRGGKVERPEKVSSRRLNFRVLGPRLGIVLGSDGGGGEEDDEDENGDSGEYLAAVHCGVWDCVRKFDRDHFPGLGN